jgi:hypothetical protein
MDYIPRVRQLIDKYNWQHIRRLPMNIPGGLTTVKISYPTPFSPRTRTRPRRSRPES